MPSWRAYWSLLPGFGTKGSAESRLLRWTATYSRGARKERRRTICASYMMMLTFGFMATSPCNSLHAALTLNSHPSAVSLFLQNDSVRGHVPCVAKPVPLCTQKHAGVAFVRTGFPLDGTTSLIMINEELG